MKHYSLDDKYNIIKTACTETLRNGQQIIWQVGLCNLDILHKIGDALGMKTNSGFTLRYLSANINRIMRQLILAGYPVKEYRIKHCSWTEKETWHPIFEIL